MNSYIKEILEKDFSIKFTSVYEVNRIDIKEPKVMTEFLFSYKNEFVYIDRASNLIFIAEDYKYIFTKEEQIRQLAFYADNCSIFKYQI